MKWLKLFLGMLSVFYGGGVFAYENHGYPYSDSQCWLEGPIDPYGFRKANCTSYAAYMLNAVYGTSFDNGYGGVGWHDGKNWDDAARSVGIAVDDYPLPGDVAYWNDGTWGHVAWVEKVLYDSNGNATGVKISEYNYNPLCQLSSRSQNETTLNIGNSDYPDGFIHILAYEEGVSSLHYLDCYEQSNLCTEQTEQEWGWIVNRVWNHHRCTNCFSYYSPVYISTLAGAVGGMGGGAGTSTPATDTADPGKPDFIVDKVWFENLNGTEKYLFNRSDEIKIRMILKNIGSEDIPGDDTIETRIYLSDGYKVDSSDNWIKIGTETTLGSELDPGENHSETEYLRLWEESHIEDGKVYNIVVCVDRIVNQNNGSGEYAEEHESNNCSTEAVFTVNVVTVPASDDLSWLPAVINLVLNGN